VNAQEPPISHSVAVVPAAGRGERFGTPLKQLVEIEGEPMLARAIRSLLDGGVQRVVVVAAAGGALADVTALADPRVHLVVNPDPSRGMFSSIQVGCAAAEGGPILVLPADMPFVKPATIAALIAASPLAAVISPTYRGKRGHPVSLPARLRHAILKADPTSTLASVLQPHLADRLELEVDDPGIVRDVDTKADLD
jgi:molybdenum cofactor cytidylyltransferase